MTEPILPSEAEILLAVIAGDHAYARQLLRRRSLGPLASHSLGEACKWILGELEGRQ